MGVLEAPSFHIACTLAASAAATSAIASAIYQGKRNRFHVRDGRTAWVAETADVVPSSQV